MHSSIIHTNKKVLPSVDEHEWQHEGTEEYSEYNPDRHWDQ